jgi:hypothetical protein
VKAVSIMDTRDVQEYDKALEVLFKKGIDPKIIEGCMSLPPSAAELGVKQTTMTAEQQAELNRIRQFKETSEMKVYEKAMKESTVSLSSNCVDWFDHVFSGLTDGSVKSIGEGLRMAAPAILKLWGHATTSDLLSSSTNLRQFIVDSANASNSLASFKSTFVSPPCKLNVPDNREVSALQRDVFEAILTLAMPRANALSQSMSSLSASVNYGLQRFQAIQSKGFELTLALLKRLEAAGVIPASALLAQAPIFQVTTGLGSRPFSFDMKVWPTWETLVSVHMIRGGTLAHNAFFRVAELCLAEAQEPTAEEVLTMHREFFSFNLSLSSDIVHEFDKTLEKVKLYRAQLARVKDEEFMKQAPVVDEATVIKAFQKALKSIYEGKQARQDDFKVIDKVISGGKHSGASAFRELVVKLVKEGNFQKEAKPVGSYGTQVAEKQKPSQSTKLSSSTSVQRSPRTTASSYASQPSGDSENPNLTLYPWKWRKVCEDTSEATILKGYSSDVDSVRQFLQKSGLPVGNIWPKSLTSCTRNAQKS